MRKRLMKIVSSFLSVMMIASVAAVVPLTAGAATVQKESVRATNFEYEICFDEKTGEDYACISRYSGNDSNIVIPDKIDGYKVEGIDSDTFYGRENIVSVTLPDSLKFIGNSAFEGCVNLKSIVIPNGVKEIGSFAFYGCESLANISIPDSVTSIGSSVFRNTLWYNNQPDGVVYFGKLLYEYKGEMPENTVITVKEGTATICNSAFSYLKNLKSITIPDSVNYIGDYVFFYCSNLEEIILPAGVDYFGYSMFSNCVKLEKVVIPEGVEELEDTFHSCSNLKEVTLPESLIAINSFTFYNCSNLRTINIPKNLETVGYNAFDACGSISNIALDAENKSFCLENGILYNKDKTVLVYSTSDQKEFSVPSSVNEIKEWAFYGNNNLEKIEFKNVKAIGDGSLAETSLKNVKIPNTVTDITYWNFYGCKSLAYAGIPGSVSSIETEAFRGCDKLKAITVPKSVKSIDYLSLGYKKETKDTPHHERFEYEDGTYDEYDWVEKEPIKYNTFTIFGYKGSEAENYANENRFVFVNLNNKDYIHSDSKTGVKVVAKAKADLKVSKTDDVTIGEDTFDLYNISLVSGGKAVQHDGYAEVKIPTANSDAKVYRVEGNNKLVETDSTYVSGYMLLYTEKSGKFAIAGAGTVIIPPEPTNPVKPAKNFKKGADGESVKKALTSTKSDGDPKGSTFNKLQLKNTSTTQKSIKLSYKKPSNTKKFVIYGAQCGSKYKVLKTTTAKSANIQNLKKGKYYKFLVVALDKNNKVVATSKTIHVATKGSKNGKSVTLKTKVTLVKNVKAHRNIQFESSDTKILKVNNQGKVTAKKKGTATIYAYAQNGVMAKVTIKVK